MVLKSSKRLYVSANFSYNVRMSPRFIRAGCLSALRAAGSWAMDPRAALSALTYSRASSRATSKRRTFGEGEPFVSSKREPATTLSEGPVGAFRGSEVNHPANMKTYSQIFQECGRHVRKPFGIGGGGGGGRWARPKMFGTRLEHVRNTLIQGSARPQSVASRPSPDPITGLHGQQPRSHHFPEVHWRLPLTQWGTTENVEQNNRGMSWKRAKHVR